jgi:hypothetical protein
MLIIEQARVLHFPFVFLECHGHESMSEKLQRVDGDVASNSNWRHYTVSFLLESDDVS